MPASKKKDKCITKGCKGDRLKGRKICNKCKMRRYRETHPYKYAYQALKDNAKRRGKEFTISFEYFKEFCILSNYLIGKGITKNGFTVDRIDSNKGYVPGNLQVLTNSQNVKKYLDYDWLTNTAKAVTLKETIKDKDLPF